MEIVLNTRQIILTKNTYYGRLAFAELNLQDTVMIPSIVDKHNPKEIMPPGD